MSPKDLISNVLAIILVVVGAVQTYLEATAGQEINWVQLILLIVGALISYFTGKTGNLKGSA